MEKPKQNDKATKLNEQIVDFLREHPEVKEILELFGIANDRYQQYLAAQQTPRFYTASSTTEGGQNGELD